MDEYLYNIDLQISTEKHLDMYEMQYILKQIKSYIGEVLDYDFVGGSVYPEAAPNGNVN